MDQRTGSEQFRRVWERVQDRGTAPALTETAPSWDAATFLRSAREQALLQSNLCRGIPLLEPVAQRCRSQGKSISAALFLLTGEVCPPVQVRQPEGTALRRCRSLYRALAQSREGFRQARGQVQDTELASLLEGMEGECQRCMARVRQTVERLVG